MSSLATSAQPRRLNPFFGPYGGAYIPPALAPEMERIEAAYLEAKSDPAFVDELNDYLAHYSGRPTPLYLCRNLSKNGAQIYLKREDLNHLGAHKINNTLGQVLLAKRMGKTRIIAETGAGQHGVASAAVAALMGMECVVYMGTEDVKRQRLNVFRMEMMGAKVMEVKDEHGGLKEAVDKAIEDLIANQENTFYLIGSAVGPHPYPTMVRDFQSVIGRESRQQMLQTEGKLPNVVLACVGGGSNAIGMFSGFVDDKDVKLIGLEPGGRSLQPGQHAATLSQGTPGKLHGSFSYVLCEENGDIMPVHSVSAGLDYPGVGPEHSYLKDIGRASYEPISDQQALDAFLTLSRTEGIIPALESSHALAKALQLAPTMGKDDIILVCLSGRGDKDVAQVEEIMGKKLTAKNRQKVVG